MDAKRFLFCLFMIVSDCYKKDTIFAKYFFAFADYFGYKASLIIFIFSVFWTFFFALIWRIRSIFFWRRLL